MSGDNMHDPQPNIRYNVKVHHHEDWEEMSLSEKMEVFIPAIKNWEKEYLTEHRKELSKQQIEILEGRELKSHEGMVFGEMYSSWKKENGFTET